MKLIQTVTVGSGGIGSVEFNSIPQTYTDLVLVASTRISDAAVSQPWIRFNGDTGSSYTSSWLQGTGGAAASSNLASTILICMNTPGSNATANTFSNNVVYIPNYTSSATKTLSSDAVDENNAASAFQRIHAGLWNNTSAITQIVIGPNGTSFVQNSVFSLYGVLKGSDGITTAS
jgi:hypothetical protein